MESEEILGPQFSVHWSPCSPILGKRFPITKFSDFMGKYLSKIAQGIFKVLIIMLLLWGILDPMAACSQDSPKPSAKEPESTRSAPPDTTPYIRKAVPEDYAPEGKKAIPPGVITKPPREEPVPEKNLPSDKTVPDKEK
jgi:hypothetical protein